MSHSAALSSLAPACAPVVAMALARYAAAPTPRHSVPSAVHGRAWTKNRENNPMQSRVDPGSQHSCCASGQEKKGPNLISSRSIRRPPTHRTDGGPNGGFTDLDVTGDEHAPEAPELQVFVWR